MKLLRFVRGRKSDAKFNNKFLYLLCSVGPTFFDSSFLFVIWPIKITITGSHHRPTSKTDKNLFSSLCRYLHLPIETLLSTRLKAALLLIYSIDFLKSPKTNIKIIIWKQFFFRLDELSCGKDSKACSRTNS